MHTTHATHRTHTTHTVHTIVYYRITVCRVPYRVACPGIDDDQRRYAQNYHLKGPPSFGAFLLRPASIPAQMAALCSDVGSFCCALLIFGAVFSASIGGRFSASIGGPFCCVVQQFVVNLLRYAAIGAVLLRSAAIW